MKGGNNEMSDEKICPACNKAMKLTEKGYPMGSAFLKADRIHVDIYTCETCGRVELFEAKSDMVKCPVCGTLHSVKEACAICALNKGLDEATK